MLLQLLVSFPFFLLVSPSLCEYFPFLLLSHRSWYQIWWSSYMKLWCTDSDVDISSRTNSTLGGWWLYSRWAIRQNILPSCWSMHNIQLFTTMLITLSISFNVISTPTSRHMCVLPIVPNLYPILNKQWFQCEIDIYEHLLVCKFVSQTEK